jgi:hypothetical protein
MSDEKLYIVLMGLPARGNPHWPPACGMPSGKVAFPLESSITENCAGFICRWMKQRVPNSILRKIQPPWS